VSRAQDRQFPPHDVADLTNIWNAQFFVIRGVEAVILRELFRNPSMSRYAVYLTNSPRHGPENGDRRIPEWFGSVPEGLDEIVILTSSELSRLAFSGNGSAGPKVRFDNSNTSLGPGSEAGVHRPVDDDKSERSSQDEPRLQFNGSEISSRLETAQDFGSPREARGATDEQSKHSSEV